MILWEGKMAHRQLAFTVYSVSPHGSQGDHPSLQCEPERLQADQSWLQGEPPRFQGKTAMLQIIKKICPQPAPIFYILNTGTWIRIPNVDADPEGKQNDDQDAFGSRS